jgi:membrane-associated protease RseP (regulator of RpoE activity)
MNWPKILRLLGSMALFASVVALLFQSEELALLITISLAVHETGHVLALRLFGIESEVGFGAIGAWTRSSARLRHMLGDLANSLIYLAGPVANIVYALLALGLDALWWARAIEGYLPRLANLNALLALLNLLPMGSMTDGGKVIKRVFTSLREDVEEEVVWALVPWLASLLWLIVLVRRDLVRAVSALLIGVWFVVEVLVEKEEDDPAGSASPRAMRPRQAIGVLLVTIGLLLASTFAVVEIPFWLTRDEVVDMIVRWASLLLYLALGSPPALRTGIAAGGLAALYLLLRFILSGRRHLPDSRDMEE